MSNEILDRVISVIAQTQRIPRERIQADSTFQELNIDSLDGINILFALENEFNINIPDDAAQKISTVRDMAEGVARLLTAGTEATAATTPNAP